MMLIDKFKPLWALYQTQNSPDAVSLKTSRFYARIPLAGIRMTTCNTPGLHQPALVLTLLLLLPGAFCDPDPHFPINIHPPSYPHGRGGSHNSPPYVMGFPYAPPYVVGSPYAPPYLGSPLFQPPHTKGGGLSVFPAGHLQGRGGPVLPPHHKQRHGIVQVRKYRIKKVDQRQYDNLYWATVHILIHTRDYSQILKTSCTTAGGQTDGKSSATFTLLNTIMYNWHSLQCHWNLSNVDLRLGVLIKY
jgi:hypothetical protein